FENIQKAERYDKTILAGKPVIYTFTAPEHGVYKIVVTGEQNEYDITLRVEVLKGTSSTVSASPPGAVYKNLNIVAGTKRIKDALIYFNVENSWLGNNNIAPGNVRLMHWDDGKWVQLETTRLAKDDSFTYYEARTGRFSPFAIVGLEEDEVIQAEPTPITTPAEEMTPAPEATEDKESPGFVVLAAILAVAGALYLRQRR
ncbi:MAG: PGF-pre-PGF domain-containing protein, partial [Candidatus Methanoperedens sp.]